MSPLAYPKPPVRIKDRSLLARFAAVRDRCQICGATNWLEIHHLADNPEIHRRSDVFDNLARLCGTCHRPKFHDAAKWTKQQVREFKDSDELLRREHYAELELQYDCQVLWAVTS